MCQLYSEIMCNVTELVQASWNTSKTLKENPVWVDSTRYNYIQHHHKWQSDAAYN